MIALVVTLVTSALEIADQLFSIDGESYREGIEVFLAAITPLLVWLAPSIKWR
jgi:hypothetical protein